MNMIVRNLRVVEERESWMRCKFKKNLRIIDAIRLHAKMSASMIACRYELNHCGNKKINNF